jgi:simple sugar transport system substrate-binding protein
MGATVNYSAPATFDMTEMASLIDAAVAKAPDGLVVSVPDYGALEASLAAASEAGIPIITVNSGSEHLEEIGAITHIGQDETIAGRAAGARLAEEALTPDAQGPRKLSRRPGARSTSSRSTSTTPPALPAR